MKSTTTTGIIRSFPSFDYFLEKAKRRISHISQKRQEKLKDILYGYLRRRSECIKSGLHSKPLEFGGFKIRIIQLFLYGSVAKNGWEGFIPILATICGSIE